MANLLLMGVGGATASSDTVAPTITSSATASVDEGDTLAHSLTANESVTWSIVGGDDQAEFEISGSTLRWASNGVQDYEAPADANTDNDYLVTVRATDLASNTADQNITVTVDDVSELWSPSDLGSALLIWLDGDTLSGSDGDAIATWADQSGNGRDFTQGTGADQPNLEVAELNSMNVVRFDRSNTEVLNGPSLSGIATAATLFYVVKGVNEPNATGEGGPVHFSTDSAANLYPFSDNNIYNGDLSSARKSVGNPTPALTSWRIVGVRSASSDWKYFLDGVQLTTTGTNTVGMTTTPKLGRGTTFGDGYWAGYMAEVILVDGAVSSGDRETVEGYLAHKWGLTANLPGGHPYKTTPP